MIKLILSDMDGTLLDENSNLPSEFDAVMKRLKERGVLFSPASGRQYYSLLRSFPAYKEDFIFVAENGAYVMHGETEIFSSTLPKDRSLALLAAAKRNPDAFCVFCGKKDAYVERKNFTPALRLELDKYYTRSQIIDTFDEVEDDALKISFFDPCADAAKNIYPLVKSFHGEFQVVLSSDYWVDVMMPNVNKGAACKRLQKHFVLKPEECAAFGDYMNDFEMMQSVYYSHAMANAHPEIKRVARFEAKSNAEHGVLRAIEEFIEKGLC